MTNQTITVTRSMLRRTVTLVVMAGIVSSGTLRGAASSAVPKVKGNDLKQQVETLEEQWRTAQLTNDAATMDKLMSDDYIGISLNGEVNTKVQQLDRYRSRRLAISRVDLSEMKVKLIRTIAIVTGRAQVEGTSDGASLQGTYRYTRVYQRLATGAWKITSFEATRIPQAGSSRVPAALPSH